MVQSYELKRATGDEARAIRFSGDLVASGKTTADGQSARVASISGGGKAFVGPRDHPFFFDLPGFTAFISQLSRG